MTRDAYSRAACFIASICSAAFILVKGVSWWWVLLFLFIGLLIFMYDEETKKP